MAPEDKYDIQRVVEEAALVVQNIGDQRISVNVTLTSPIMREQLLHEGGNTDRLYCSLVVYSDRLRRKSFTWIEFITLYLDEFVDEPIIIFVFHLFCFISNSEVDYYFLFLLLLLLILILLTHFIICHSSSNFICQFPFFLSSHSA